MVFLSIVIAALVSNPNPGNTAIKEKVDGGRGKRVACPLHTQVLLPKRLIQAQGSWVDLC